MALPFPVPASLDPSFAITRPTEADLDGLARIYYDSFATDPLTTFWWSLDRDAMFEWLRARLIGRLTDQQKRHFQVVDSEREVISFARWDIPKGYEATFGEWTGINGAALNGPGDVVNGGDNGGDATAEKKSASAGTSKFPKGVDPAVCEVFFSMLSRMSEKWHAEEMLGLSLLCTSPKYYRRGAASALLEPMLAIADSVGLRSYLEATPTGRPLYERLGFKTVDVHEFDVGKLTGGRMEGITSISIMIREPQPLQGKPM